MKDFVKGLIRSFLGKDTQFAITQYSSSTVTHYYFNSFKKNEADLETQINTIHQLFRGTNTAAAIREVVDDVFSPLKGSRSNVKKILIIITDGESHDHTNLPSAINSADNKKIARFAIGVGDAFSTPRATQELRMIASQPAENFVFKVGSFDALDKIRDSLQDNIFSIEGGISTEKTGQITTQKSEVITTPVTEFPLQADIAFLLDGSGSVSGEDFRRMKDFVKGLIRSFLGKDTQFAITQYSSSTVTHYYFNSFKKNEADLETQINTIHQLFRGTNTAAAIREVVDDVFSPQKGSRSNVKKILIVITDGESHDHRNLLSAINSADNKKIARFAIGVGNAFSSYSATQELRTIASQPAENFVFKVGSFDALDKIRDSLQDNIFSIEGGISTEKTGQITTQKSEVITTPVTEFPLQADIAFLLDGSGSVSSEDFRRMKDFVKGLIRSFLGKDTQFAITQYSRSTVTHYYFNSFKKNEDDLEPQIKTIRQLMGGTYTAAAIREVVDDVFSPLRGSRSNVRKILIVITDGESQDRINLQSAINSANNKKIARFAIGVSCMY
ncbi:collagen alpha-6(VI) chain [Fundulus heteroclitus]|uniref:collagen alpha-6(VI) chain n=1 Tax=Fundulus heteroclitus TaxID=8078 RepID=UPI00165B4DC8|nr:collagen alpha-6(VI) chain [Fundulus heteroclitus]